MIVVLNKTIPFRGYIAMTLWPFIFVRDEEKHKYDDVVRNHEKIHGEQQKEMFVLPFLLWYGVEWLVRMLYFRDARMAYRTISFEQEAYAKEKDESYLTNGGRRHYTWARYLFNV